MFNTKRVLDPKKEFLILIRNKKNNATTKHIYPQIFDAKSMYK